MNKSKIHLVVIDPQNDFCNPVGALFVKGADEDMIRLETMIKRLGSKIDDIHVTLDSHHYIDIAHPAFWKDAAGNNAAPFTIISVDDVKQGKYITTAPHMIKRATEYVEKLAANGRYPLCIWPPHCLIGSWGHEVYTDLYKTLLDWEKNNFAMIDFVTKGSNFWTEHYSAIQADVPDPTDPGTMLNTKFIETLQEADIILLAGEAKSHCLANTVTDIANNFGEENVSKFVLLEDCTSNVTGFEQMGDRFLEEMKKRGMQISNSKDFLK